MQMALFLCLFLGEQRTLFVLVIYHGDEFVDNAVILGDQVYEPLGGSIGLANAPFPIFHCVSGDAEDFGEFGLCHLQCSAQIYDVSWRHFGKLFGYNGVKLSAGTAVGLPSNGGDFFFGSGVHKLVTSFALLAILGGYTPICKGFFRRNENVRQKFI